MGSKIFFFLFFICSLKGVEFSFEDTKDIKKLVRQLVGDTFDDIVSDPVYGALLLKNSFYRHTHPLRKKSLLDIPRLHDKQEEWNISFFYNQIDKEYYKESNPGIGSYLNIEQEGILEVLDELEFQNEKLPNVLALLDAIKTQERRTGFIFSKKGSFKEVIWELQVPLLYQEYNFYLSAQERQLIEEEALFTKREAPKQVEGASANAGGSSGAVDFFKRHLLSDKIGISDARLAFIFSKGWSLFFTIPCAFAFKKGVVGSYFDPYKKGTGFDLHADLVDLYVEGDYTQLKQNTFDYGLAALERASAILLENPLGNRRHLGCGVIKKIERKFFKRGLLALQGQAELLLPATERRFIKIIPDESVLNAIHISSSPPEEEARLKVIELNKPLQENLFPESYNIIVFPGLILQANASFLYTKGLWEMSLGGQVWFHTKEKFLDIEKGAVSLSRLDAKTAKQGYALQQNIYACIEKKRSYESAWVYGLEVLATVVSTGRAKDRFISFYYALSL
jgi:hypothetical protein